MSPIGRMLAALREFRRPRLWLGLWLLGWLLCVALSLAHPPRIGVDLPEGDKLGHFLAYGLLSAWSAWIFATRRARGLAALALVALGIAMEIAQGTLTDDRMMDVNDAWADAIGVLIGQLFGFGRAQRLLQRLETKLPG